jgi:glycosyltransferase involved in cell wall biosynthesis
MLQILRPGRELIESVSLLPLPWWLAAGVPTIVSARRGAGDVIQNDVDGEILLRSGRDEIAAAIMRFCDDRKRLSKMAQAAEDRWQPAKRVAGNAGATSVQ